MRVGVFAFAVLFAGLIDMPAGSAQSAGDGIAPGIKSPGHGFEWFFANVRKPDAACAGEHVVATWYSVGNRTASGDAFDANGHTAAHRTLPFGTRVTVTNPRNGKSVVVTINDRGPFTKGVTLDLARGAARVIDMKDTQWVCMAVASQ
jgi:rare lipoprotein A